MRFPVFFASGLLLLAGCRRHETPPLQGYLEGDFIYVASPIGGQLETLAVKKGARVDAGAPLFSLERSAERDAVREASDRLRAAQSRLEDLKKGSRPTEIAALEARVAQAKASAELSRLEFVRVDELFRTHVVAESDFDRARLTHERDVGTLNELTSQLATARLGGRSDAVAAAESDVHAAAAAAKRAAWSVDQKAQSAPRAGLVYDTLYREGEFVAASAPVVVLLPPENLKVRFFVPEPRVASLKSGDAITVSFSGGKSLRAHVSYVSPQPEYTPPVLYNRENRAKLVFMIEALFDGQDARDLHPGQPVDVTLGN